MNKIKSMAWAFVISGVVGLLGAVLFAVLFALTPTLDPTAAVIITLVVMALLGGILVLTGAYKPLEDRGEMGIMGTFLGLLPAAANMYAQGRQSGASAGKAALKAFGVIMLLVLIGAIIACAIAAIFIIVGGLA